MFRECVVCVATGSGRRRKSGETSGASGSTFR